MLNDLTIGQYLPLDSPVHRLDPRTKLLAVTLLVALLFFVHGFAGYALVAAFLGMAVALSRISLRYLIRGLRPLWLIIAITLALHLFMTEGRVLAYLGPLKITHEGLIRGLLMTIRLVLLIALTSLLTLSTSPIALTDGIESLLGPFRRFGVPAHELAMMMTIALRFIPTLLEEAEKIMKAQMARGADFESGHLMQRAKNLVPLLVPLFVGAFRRADELATAMEARCYRGGEGRTKFRPLVMRRVDWVALGATAVFAVVVAWRF
ncbi:MAG: energy-coupling factor transporter transmembrane component T [Bacillota bacterium]|nr:energy-coupling factor transporter transmembrane component T [Bacillota bacterium]